MYLNQNLQVFSWTMEQEKSNNSKKRPNRSNDNAHGGKFKKQKKIDKFWIETCREKSPNNPNVLKYAVHVLITRAELRDDHPHPSNTTITGSTSSGITDTSLTTNASSIGTTTEDTYTSIIPASAHLLQPSADKDTASIASEISDMNASKDTDTVSTVNDAVSTRPEPFVSIHIDPSARRIVKWQNSNKNYKVLPNGDCGDGILNPFPSTVVPNKYWAQRRRLFSKFDEGIQLDAESWYSVTPEVIANHTARRLCTSLVAQQKKYNYYPQQQQKKFVVLDAFCGCGGNAIAFALQPEISQVVCVDIDRNKLLLLATNASIYGVNPDKLLLVLADGISILKYHYRQGELMATSRGGTRNIVDNNNGILTESQKEETISFPEGYSISGVECLPPRIDSVFLSPPWGGPSYATGCNKKSLNLEDLIRMSHTPDATSTTAMIDGTKLLQLASHATEDGRNIIYFLPKNINGISVGKAVAALPKSFRKKGDMVELEQNYVNGKLKTVTAYVGLSLSKGHKKNFT